MGFTANMAQNQKHLASAITQPHDTQKNGHKAAVPVQSRRLRDEPQPSAYELVSCTFELCGETSECTS